MLSRFFFASLGRVSAISCRPFFLIGASLLLGFNSSAFAQDFPRQSIRIIVPFTAGSATDLGARDIAQNVAQSTGWSIIVDNKGGANGFIAIQDFLRAPPDGHTLIMTGNTTQAANPVLFKKIPYDPIQDFAPITRTAVVPLVLFVAPKHNVQSFAELIALVKKSPGKLSFASGSASHRLASELLRQRANLNVNHVPYKGSAQALTDLVGGHVDFMFVDTAVGMSFIKAGTLKPLAVTALQPVEALLGVPTMVALGFPGFQVSGWSALFAPAKTPLDVQTKLFQTINNYLSSPAGRKYVNDRAGFFEPMTPEQTAQWAKSELENYRKIFAQAGIEAE